MARKKSTVLQAICNILDQSVYEYVDQYCSRSYFIDSRNNGYGVKFLMEYPGDSRMFDIIANIYATSPNIVSIKWNSGGPSNWSGLRVMFDCRPKDALFMLNRKSLEFLTQHTWQTRNRL